MRTCSICKLAKPLDQFHKKSATTYQSSCKECRKVYVKQHYEANKQAYLQRNAVQQKRKRAEVSALRNVPCMDCDGVFPPYVLHFDHVRGVKKGNIMTMAGKVSKQALEEEIAKCEIVCANCHAIRTYQRLHSSNG